MSKASNKLYFFFNDGTYFYLTCSITSIEEWMVWIACILIILTFDAIDMIV